MGDIFVTATGNKHVLRGEHFEVMKDGAVLANTGHFDVEVDIPALRDLSVSSMRARAARRALRHGRRARPLPARRGPARQPGRRGGAPGVGHGHELREPGALGRVRRPEPCSSLEARVYTVPKEIDDEIARLKLESMAFAIDELTDEQRRYMDTWDEGT